MRKMLAGAALCVVTVVGLGAGPAMAGEITGKGDRPMVIGQTTDGHMILHARSACAFSGLNDEYIESDRDPAHDRVQNWGHIPGHEGAGRFGPGTACRGGAPLEE